MNLDEAISSDPYLQGYFDGAIELLHLEHRNDLQGVNEGFADILIRVFDKRPCRKKWQ